MLTKKPIKMPPGLGASKRLWREITEQYVEWEPHHLKLLELICTTWDRISEARHVLQEQGLYLTDRYGVLKEHPSCITERQNKSLFMRLTRELGLDISPPTEQGRGKRRY
jgi:phage terminase small subunit